MSIRRANRDHSRNKNAISKMQRLRDKAQQLRTKLKESCQALLVRYEARREWWQRAFRVPNVVGAWIFSQARSLWLAIAQLIGIQMRPSIKANRKKHQFESTDSFAILRGLLHEPLEERRLLATVVWDGGGADNKWTTAANWVGDAAPLANDDLVFPVAAAQKTNLNDFPVGTKFGGMLLNGSGYTLSGNQIELSGSISSTAANTFDVDLKLGTGLGISSSGGTFTVTSDIDTNGNALSLNAGSELLVSGQISGGGSLTTAGNSTVVLSGNNSYTGITTVSSGVLSVQHNNALGAGTNVAADGTNITNNNALVRLENGVTVSSERLSAATSTQIQLASSGTGTTNTWGGSIVSGTNQHVYFQPFASSRLKIDGTTTFSTPNSYILAFRQTGAKAQSRSMER